MKEWKGWGRKKGEGADFVLAAGCFVRSGAAEAGHDDHRVPAMPRVHCLGLVEWTEPSQGKGGAGIHACLSAPASELTARDACFEPIASVEAQKFQA